MRSAKILIVVGVFLSIIPQILPAQSTQPAEADSIVWDFEDLTPFVDPAVPWDHPLTAGQWERLQLMRGDDPGLEVHWEPNGVLSRIKGRLGPSTKATEGGEMAFEFLLERQDLFMQPEPSDVFDVALSHSDDMGWTHVRLQQTYKGIPVEGAQIALHFDGDRVPRVVNCSHFVPALDLNTNAQVDLPAAIATSLAHLGVASASGAPAGSLVIYDHAGKAYLAWRVNMFVADPLGDFIYYIDARTGAVVDSYNNLKSALDRDVHDATNGTTLPGALIRSEGGGASGDTDVDAAYDNAGTVYNYFNTNHGRDGINGSGLTIVSTVHYDVALNNAFWNGSQMVYGDGDGTTFAPLARALDVVAHELVHGITQFTSNLVYQDESGALNESLSDIFAALIDPDWKIGEDVYTPGTAGDALRSLSDPTCCSQPDHYDDLVTANASGSALDQSCNSSTNQDNGCVHFNSGIPNKAAYLMSVGGTFSGITVNGIGNADMGDIWYETQVNWLTARDDFANARQATIDAATNLYGAANARVTTVKNAWAAVGVGVPEASIVPPALAFGNVAIGSTLDLDLTLSNPGDVDLVVSALASDDAQFTIVTAGQVPFTITAGGSRTGTFRYTPDVNTPGDDSGNLTLTHNAANSPTTVAMTGSAAINLSVTGLRFINAFGTTDTQAFTLTNPSTAVINISSVVSTSSFFGHDGGPVAIGAGGGTAVINVTYTNKVPGQHTGQLLISHNPTVVLTLIGGSPVSNKDVAAFVDGFTTTKTAIGVPFGTEYLTLLIAGAYGAYVLRRHRNHS
jgi:bacillolysin